MMLHAFTLCAALVAPPAALARTADLCGCMGPRTEMQAVLRSAATFEGRVLRSRRVQRGNGLPGIVYTFAVIRWRNGGSSDTVSVVTGLGGGDCGVRFDRRHTYTVYTYWDHSGALATSTCSAPFVSPFGPRRRLPNRSRR